MPPTQPIWRERSVREMRPGTRVSAAEGATRPETLRQKNGDAWWALESGPAGAHRRGAAPVHRRPISQVTGQRGGRLACGLPPFFMWSASRTGTDMGLRTPLYDLHVAARRAHGRLRRLGHAGPLRLADRGAPRGAPRRRHVRRLAHVRRRPARRRACATSCAACSPTTSPSSRSPARRSTLHAERARRRDRRPDRLLPGRAVVPPGRQRRHARQGPRVDARACRRASACARSSRAATWR